MLPWSVVKAVKRGQPQYIPLECLSVVKAVKKKDGWDLSKWMGLLGGWYSVERSEPPSPSSHLDQHLAT